MDLKNKFSIFKNRNIHYFDTAATSQKPTEILDKILKYYENDNGNPGRGSHQLAIKAEEHLTKSRKTVQHFINAKNSSEIIFTKNTTESLNLLAYSYGLDNLSQMTK